MATNICLDCAYLGGKCTIASEEIRECNEYKFIRREIERKEERMKVMISQPMNGKTNEQIESERENIVKRLHDMHIEVIDTVFNFEVRNVNNKPVYYLAKSIEEMSNADAVLFMKGWNEARGCLIEHAVATEYGIKALYEDFVNDDKPLRTAEGNIK